MKVKFLPQDVEFEIKPNQSVLTVAQDNGVHIQSVCKGLPSCAECRVKVVEGYANVLPPFSEEVELIGTAHFVDQRRLSCQLRCYGDIVVNLDEQIEKEGDSKKQPQGKFIKKEGEDSHARMGNMFEELGEETEAEIEAEVKARVNRQSANKTPTKPKNFLETKSKSKGDGPARKKKSRNRNKNKNKNGPGNKSKGKPRSGPVKKDSKS